MVLNLCAVDVNTVTIIGYRDGASAVIRPQEAQLNGRRLFQPEATLYFSTGKGRIL